MLDDAEGRLKQALYEDKKTITSIIVCMVDEEGNRSSLSVPAPEAGFHFGFTRTGDSGRGKDHKVWWHYVLSWSGKKTDPPVG